MANWKHEITLYITHDILTNDKNPHGYLLWLLQSYLILDTYASLEVHTTETLEKGEEALRYYAAIMQVGQHFTTSLSSEICLQVWDRNILKQLNLTVKKPGTFQRTTHMSICLPIFLRKESHRVIIQKSMKACMGHSKIHINSGQTSMILQSRYLLKVFIDKHESNIFIIINRFFVQTIGSMFQDTSRLWLHLWMNTKQKPLTQRN